MREYGKCDDVNIANNIPSSLLVAMLIVFHAYFRKIEADVATRNDKKKNSNQIINN